MAIFGASAIQCCYAAIEIAELPLPLDFLCKMNTQTDRAKRRKVAIEVKMSRKVSLSLANC
jgi:hypothetical protein